jgi:hypothetical protein
LTGFIQVKISLKVHVHLLKNAIRFGRVIKVEVS